MSFLKQQRRMLWRRLLLALIAISAILLSWTGASLVARHILPGTAVLADRLFAAALAATYFGGWMLAIALAQWQRPMLLRAAATTLTITTLVLVLELPAAFKWLHWTLVFRSLSGEGATDYMTSYVLDPELSFRRIPGLHWTARPYSDIEDGSGLPRSLRRSITFTYDRSGYRNAVEMPQADIVLVGDSFAEGWYVSDEETTAAVLGRRLGLRVANLGVAGYGTLQELRVIQGDGMRRNPRVVIWYFFEGNDLYEDQDFENAMLAVPPSVERMTPNASGLTKFDGWAKRSFISNAFQRLRRLSHPIVPTPLAIGGTLRLKNEPPQQIHFGPEASLRWRDYEQGRWATAAKAFEKGIAFAHDRGVHVMLVFVPYKYRVYQDFVTDLHDYVPGRQWKVWPEFPAKVLELCETLRVPCVDATEVLTASLRHGVMVYPLTDTHWSAEGHAVVAAELERRLRQLRWVR